MQPFSNTVLWQIVLLRVSRYAMWASCSQCSVFGQKTGCTLTILWHNLVLEQTDQHVSSASFKQILACSKEREKFSPHPRDCHCILNGVTYLDLGKGLGSSTSVGSWPWVPIPIHFTCPKMFWRKRGREAQSEGATVTDLTTFRSCGPYWKHFCRTHFWDPSFTARICCISEL